MKITRIQDKHGKPVGSAVFYQIQAALSYRFSAAGFNTCIHMDNLPSIKIGLGMKSFIIDPVRRGQNADVGRWAQKASVKGYKRTCTPTWEEREEFNHIINDIFDKLKLSANIRNSLLTIRYAKTGRVNSWDFYRFGAGERFYYEIVKESELIKQKSEVA